MSDTYSVNPKSSHKAEVLSYIGSFVSLTILIIFILKFPHTLDSFGMSWYPFIGISLALTLFICRICTLLEKWKISRSVIKFLSFIGKCSLEIYLLHEIIFAKAHKYELSTLPWFGIYITVIIIGCLYHIVIEKLKSRFICPA